MARKVIELVSGEKYHVYNRGTDKRNIFSSKSDFVRFYMSLDVFNTIEPTHNFEDSKNKERLLDDRLVQVYAYSLLPNHFHLILEQLVDGGISEFMKRVAGGYTSYFNDKEERSGSLFQGTFKRIHIDTDEYYNYLFSYVNENHFVHEINRPNEICYSSSFHYQGLFCSKILPSKSTKYDLKESIKIAKMIAEERRILKTET